MDNLGKQYSVKLVILLVVIIIISMFLGSQLTNMNINQSVNVEVSSDSPTRKVDLNTAPIEELMSLHGIGETKAKKIIEYRNKDKIESVYELLKIDGIGEDVVDNIKSEVLQ